MNALVMMVVLATSLPCPKPKRSVAARAAFVRQHPCPKSCALYKKDGKVFRLYYRCGACQVDHVCPVACCGADAPANMQWMDAKENRGKGADCTRCEVKAP